MHIAVRMVRTPPYDGLRHELRPARDRGASIALRHEWLAVLRVHLSNTSLSCANVERPTEKENTPAILSPKHPVILVIILSMSGAVSRVFLIEVAANSVIGGVHSKVCYRKSFGDKRGYRIALWIK